MPWEWETTTSLSAHQPADAAASVVDCNGKPISSMSPLVTCYENATSCQLRKCYFFTKPPTLRSVCPYYNPYAQSRQVQRPNFLPVGNKVITNGTYFAQLHKGQKKGRKEGGTRAPFFLSLPQFIIPLSPMSFPGGKSLDKQNLKKMARSCTEMRFILCKSC